MRGVMGSGRGGEVGFLGFRGLLLGFYGFWGFWDRGIRFDLGVDRFFLGFC